MAPLSILIFMSLFQHNYLNKHQVDFCFYFSSISGIMLVNSVYLDCLSDWQVDKPLYVTTILWCPAHSAVIGQSRQEQGWIGGRG